ncbi:LuxR C-terminal-related transcriptional regulator [Streptomyces sp. NPDC048565]|uniref:helix-turn-helix transcriptional regulator n=1 Tax=Streptomyces sp. NPDC048565 TaxID=3155266 RepID=UPI003441DDCB
MSGLSQEKPYIHETVPNTTDDHVRAALAQAQTLIQSALRAHDSGEGAFPGPVESLRTEDAFRAAMSHWQSQPRRTPPELSYVDVNSLYSCSYGGAWPMQEWLLERGAPLRVLTAAPGETCRIGCMERVLHSSAQVRVSMHPLPGFAVLNRTVAILPAVHRDPAHSVLVREPHTVNSLSVLFDAVFSRATDWSIAMRFASPDGDEEDEVLLQVLHLMGTGRTDEVTARELGMSVRTFRRHVSEVMQRLGASSRFQAGLRAAELGLTTGASSVPEEPPPGRGRTAALGVSGRPGHSSSAGPRS